MCVTQSKLKVQPKSPSDLKSVKDKKRNFFPYKVEFTGCHVFAQLKAYSKKH